MGGSVEEANKQTDLGPEAADEVRAVRDAIAQLPLSFLRALCGWVVVGGKVGGWVGGWVGDGPGEEGQGRRGRTKERRRRRRRGLALG